MKWMIWGYPYLWKHPSMCNCASSKCYVSFHQDKSEDLRFGASKENWRVFNNVFAYVFPYFMPLVHIPVPLSRQIEWKLHTSDCDQIYQLLLQEFLHPFLIGWFHGFHMYVCMYVCMHACMHACMHVWMYVHIN